MNVDGYRLLDTSSVVDNCDRHTALISMSVHRHFASQYACESKNRLVFLPQL
jgi:hypothetical protein